MDQLCESIWKMVAAVTSELLRGSGEFMNAKASHALDVVLRSAESLKPAAPPTTVPSVRAGNLSASSLRRSVMFIDGNTTELSHRSAGRNVAG